MTLVFLEVGGRGWSQGALFVWVLFTFCLVNSAYTVVFVPYAALTPELASDFQERTNLNGYRMAWAIVGTLLGAGAFPIVVELAAGAGMGSGYTLAGRRVRAAHRAGGADHVRLGAGAAAGAGPGAGGQRVRPATRRR